MASRFFIYHYLHVCLLFFGIVFLLFIVFVIKPNLAKPEYFKNYGQKGQGWARSHGKTINRVSYAIIVAFIILYAVVIWKQVLDIPNYISGNFETVSGVVWKTESNGHFITLEDGSNYTVDLKGIERGDEVTLRYLPISHCSSILEVNGKEVRY